MLRIITYNVRHCLGRDWRTSPERVAAVLAPFKPDVIALQELDVGRRRSGSVDQAEAIARELGMQMHFHPAMTTREELYGNAILTAAPSRLIKGGALPTRPRAEPRGALWAALETAGMQLQVINTHLGLRRVARIGQIEALVGPDWLGAAVARGPTLLCGDLNSVPRSPAYGRAVSHFREIGALPPLAAGPTFPSRWPILRLDHVFAGPRLRVTRATVIRTPLARIASDHLPLMVDFCHEPG